MFLNDGGGPVVDTVNFFTNSFQSGGDIATFGLGYTSANLVSDSSITTANLRAMTINRTTNFTIAFSGAGSFSATVTGVPEPATTASLFALVAGFATCRVIRRRKAGK
ncbi:MAG: PEP-CTERM sorting domain-containing protein [Pirellulales bacterium]